MSKAVQGNDVEFFSDQQFVYITDLKGMILYVNDFFAR
jgi:hypothetical protein